MSEQRVDVGAAAAVGEDADPGVGQGAQDQAVHHRGEAAEQDAPRENLDEQREDTSLVGEGDTEGEREVRSARDGGAS